MTDGNSKKSKLSWSKKMVRKWLNIKSKNEDFEADEVVYGGGDVEHRTSCSEREPCTIKRSRTEKFTRSHEQPRRRMNLEHPRIIEVQNYSVFVATWNVGGRSPSSNLSLDEWLHASPPADIYVLGFQEIVPLNVGNVLGAEDNGPAKKWRELIRRTLNSLPGTGGNNVCYTPSPIPEPIVEINADFEGSIRRKATSFFHRRSFQTSRSCRMDSDPSVSQPRLERRYSVCDRVMSGHRPSDADSSYRWGHRPSDYSGRPSDYSWRPSDYNSRPSDFSRRPSDYNSRLSDYSRRTSDYNGRLSDYSRRTSDYNGRPSDYNGRPSDYSRRPSDYNGRPSDYSRRPSDYNSRPSDYSRRPSDYNGRPSNHSRRPSDYSGRPSDHSRRPSDYTSRLSDYNGRPSDYSRRPSDYSSRPSDFSRWGSSDDDLRGGDSPSTVLYSPMSYSASASAEDGYRMPGHSRYCLVASKQMVGIYLTIWVRSDLREHVRNMKVSCVGRGLMGYLGNKGSISISMTLHKTSFCFVCSHLTSGQKEGDELRRNADVVEILKKTRFPRVSGVDDEKSPQTILEHDRVIWLGDLNYRIALSYRSAKALVEMQNWRALLQNDQLRIEQRRGRIFRGWKEGKIYFPPTYKYSTNSDRYSGDGGHTKEKRRTPAWCDRILWYGQGLQQLSYVRGESRFSDHRPVYGIFWAEVESTQSRLKKSMSYCSSRVAAEELWPYSHGYTELNFF